MNINGLENVNGSLSTHYTIYKITNNINGKYYIGQHITNNIFDNYTGSGKLILAAELKYNLSSFTKTILFDFDNFNDMNNKEYELVQLSNCYPNDQMSYNLREGGGHKFTTDIKLKMSVSASKKYENAKQLNAEWYKKFCEKQSKHTSGKNNPRYGKTPFEYKSEEWKSKYKEKLSSRVLGIKNPNFKYPRDLVLKMAEEYNKFGYLSVVEKFGYSATKDKLLSLFNRNNIEWKKRHFTYTVQQISDAIHMIKEYGFEKYSNWCFDKYGFKPIKSNFQQMLKRRKMYTELQFVI